MADTIDQPHITFERSGGFGGLTLRTEVDLAGLDDDERRRFNELLAGLDLPALARQKRQPPTGADRYQYDLKVVGSGERQYDLSFGEQSVPSELQPLVQKLLDHARSHPAR